MMRKNGEERSTPKWRKFLCQASFPQTLLPNLLLPNLLLPHRYSGLSDQQNQRHSRRHRLRSLCHCLLTRCCRLLTVTMPL
jgi:hypothetical protein